MKTERLLTGGGRYLLFIVLLAGIVVGMGTARADYTTLGHTADQIGPGAFAAGEYFFPGTSTIGIGLSTSTDFIFDIRKTGERVVQIGDNAGNQLSIDVAGGKGLVNLVAGAKIDPSLGDYIYTSNIRGASRIQLHDSSLKLMTGTLIDGVTGQPVIWNTALTINNAGDVIIGDNICLGGTCVPDWNLVEGLWSFHPDDAKDIHYSTTGGNVGIGTGASAGNEPMEKLSIRGGTTGEYEPLNLRADDNQALVSNAYFDSITDNRWEYLVNSPAGIIQFVSQYDASEAPHLTNGIAIKTAEPSGGTFPGVPVTWNLGLFIDTDGEVGVGTSNPDAELEVRGEVDVGGKTPGGSGGSITVGDDTYRAAAAPGSGMMIQGSVGIGTSSVSNDMATLTVVGNASIGSYTSSPPSDGMIVSGDVGIATATPATPLDVGSGSTRSTNADIVIGDPRGSGGLPTIELFDTSKSGAISFDENVGFKFYSWVSGTTWNNDMTVHDDGTVEARNRFCIGGTADCTSSFSGGWQDGNPSEIYYNGRVGIGTNDPDDQLTLDNGASESMNFRIAPNSQSIMANAYYSGGWKYKQAGYAEMIIFSNPEPGGTDPGLRFLTAIRGTVADGPISWIEGMYIDQNGGVDIGNGALVIGTDDSVTISDLVLTGGLSVGGALDVAGPITLNTNLISSNRFLDLETSSGTASYVTLNPISTASGTQAVRLFRDSTATTGTTVFNIHNPGTSTVSFQVNAKTGNVLASGSGNTSLDIVSTGSNTNPNIELANGVQTWMLSTHGSESSVFRISDMTGTVQRPFQIETNSPTNLLYLDSAGEIGINTNDPGSELHVTGASNLITDPVAIFESSGTNAPIHFIAGGSVMATVGVDDTGDLVLSSDYSNIGTGDILFASGVEATFNNIARFKNDGNAIFYGDVGIGGDLSVGGNEWGLGSCDWVSGTGTVDNIQYCPNGQYVAGINVDPLGYQDIYCCEL
jgi:hypothetical protein